MKGLLHWMLCHTVMIVLLLFLLTAIYFRGPLFGIWPEPDPQPVVETPIPSNPETPVTTVSKQDGQPLEQPAADETSTNTEMALDVIEPDDAAVPPATTITMPAATDPVAEPSDELVLLPETPAEPEQTQPQTSADVSSVTQSPEVVDLETVEAQRLQDNYQFRSEEEQPVAQTDFQQDLLQQARKAYWNDDLEKARTLYQAYINLHPENPDGYGELGNLLSTEGNLQSASYMYRKAADLLTRQGRTEEAQQLKEVLSSIEVIQNSYD